MARVKKNNQPKTSSGANVGYEAALWQMADALRGSTDAAEYKHVVLGLIFLRYVSEAFVLANDSISSKQTGKVSMIVEGLEERVQ